MNPFQAYSPASPSPMENEGLSSLELELENRRMRIPILNERYEKALVAMESADRKLQLAENKKRSFRNKRKREDCNGCKRKWCNTCEFNNAAKKVRVIGLDIEFNESEIKVISQEVELERQQRRERAQSNAFQSVPPCPEPPFSDDEDDSITDNSDDVEPVKEEADIKVEPEDSFVSIPFRFTIGMVNTVKTEPMDPNDDINGTISDNTSDEDTDYTTDDDFVDVNDCNNDSIETDEEIQDQYPDTPAEDTDYSTDNSTDYTTDDSADSDNDGDFDADADPIQRFRNILNKL